MPQSVIHGTSRLTEEDIYLFKEGRHFQLYHKLGAHRAEHQSCPGTQFAVWAPNALSVSVIGEFNGWASGAHPLSARWDGSGIWEGFIPGVGQGALYKYHIVSSNQNYQVEKTDPVGFRAETPPLTASVVWNLDYEWKDASWMQNRKEANGLSRPCSVYEVHLGSWRRIVEDNCRPLSYVEMADQLTGYVKDMGFTHVEFLPVMEHPFYGSWGYQTVGYFSPTGRYGTPQQLMTLIDRLHQNGIGVILDWVPSHFPSDVHGLVYFDGTHLYEHQDPRKGFHPDWKCHIFNNGRNEVKEFLISSALFWLDYYHADGLRVDAVASMLYLDYSRKAGEWSPNEYGGRENIDSIHFIRQLNEAVYEKFPDVQMIAEESTAWSMVSRPTSTGGLGFGMKWNMGWMHDTLKYLSCEPVHRKYHHNELTFSMLYAFTENFILSLSHDEVVHGKNSLLMKMPGDQWQKFANLRLLYTYMFGHPGKKLLFMGGEFAQVNEWYHERSLDWHLLDDPMHRGIQALVRDLNHLYRREPALWSRDFDGSGFEWIDGQDWEKSVVSFVRRDPDGGDAILVACNFTPVPRPGYCIGVPHDGVWEEIFNSDAAVYGGGEIENLRPLEAQNRPYHGKAFSVNLTLPPLAVVFFKNKKISVHK